MRRATTIALGLGVLGSCQTIDHPSGRIEGAARVDLRIYNAGDSALRMVSLRPTGTQDWYGTGDIGLVEPGTSVIIHPTGDLPFCRMDVYVSNADGETETYDGVDTCSYGALRFPKDADPSATPRPTPSRVPHPGQQEDQLHPVD